MQKKISCVTGGDLSGGQWEGSLNSEKGESRIEERRHRGREEKGEGYRHKDKKKKKKKQNGGRTKSSRRKPIRRRARELRGVEKAKESPKFKG